jgi:hypothetical protein
MKNDPLRIYLVLEEIIRELGEASTENETPIERIRDAMDEIWWRLGPEACAYLNSRGET